MLGCKKDILKIYILKSNIFRMFSYMSGGRIARLLFFFLTRHFSMMIFSCLIFHLLFPKF